MLTEQIAAILGQWMAGSFSIRGVDYSAAKNHTLRWPDDFSEAEQEGFRAVAQEVGHLPLRQNEKTRTSIITLTKRTPKLDRAAPQGVGAPDELTKAVAIYRRWEDRFVSSPYGPVSGQALKQLLQQLRSHFSCCNRVL